MALLAIIGEEDANAYRIRKRFEERTGGAWPLNAGQVSTTLARLLDTGWVSRTDPPAGPSEQSGGRDAQR